MKKSSLIACLVFTFIFNVVPALADTPMVISFNASSSLLSGQAANFNWVISGGGHSFMIFCSQGVKLKYISNNQTFPCDTRVSVSSAASDGLSVIVANVSGGPRILTAEIIPKDGNKMDYDPGAKEVSIYLNPERQPITNFYTTSTTTVSGSLTTFYWTSAYLDGVNFKIACNDSITATSSTFGSGPVPCGQIIFPTDLAGSGSVGFHFNNSSTSDLPLDVTIFPATSPGVYNGINAQTITIKAASDAQKPVSLSYFTASRQKIFSGDSVAFSWSYLNASGVNLKFACANYLIYDYFTSTSTVSLPCDVFAWQNPLASTGSSSITFLNSSPNDQTVDVSVFPELKNATYDGGKSTDIKITVQSYLSASTSSANSAAAKLPAATVPATSPPLLTQTLSATSAGAAKNIFRRPLDIGSRGDDVKSLQIFLAKDKNIYPEGLTTGYFGAITARAVGRFQVKYTLVKSSQEPAYGFVGAKTRALLNSLQ